jgi:hypothetical protein
MTIMSAKRRHAACTKPLSVPASLRAARTINVRAAPPPVTVRGLPSVATKRVQSAIRHPLPSAHITKGL